ncbi:MAG TPA: DUF6504 family protein [Ktedonobacterales bacterium]
MSRRYQEAITVTLQGERLTSFTWRGNTYRIRVIANWRLAARWWSAEHAANRHYYRVMTADCQVFEVYHDQVSGAWILDTCLD